MDFRNLASDELEYECMLRDVGKVPPVSFEQLETHQANAASFNFEAARMGRGTNTEISLIAEKGEILSRAMPLAIEQSDLTSLEIFVSRFLHLLNRLAVLREANSDLPIVNRMRVEYEQSIDKAKEAIKSISGPEPEPLANPFNISAIATTTANPTTNHTSTVNQNTGTIPREPIQTRSRGNGTLQSLSTFRRPSTRNSSRYNNSMVQNQQNQFSNGSQPIQNNHMPHFSVSQSFVPRANTNGSNQNRNQMNRPNFSTTNVRPQLNHRNNVRNNYNIDQTFRDENDVLPIPIRPVSNVPVRNSEGYRHSGKNPLGSWSVRFDGTDSVLPVEEFIFRVELMAEGESVSNQDLAAGLHYLLTGNALTWFWLFKRRNRNAPWNELVANLKSEFKNRDTDYEIRKKADATKQAARESFSDFKLRVEAELSRLNNPISEEEKLSMLKRNLKPDLRKAVFYRDIRSTVDLAEMCREFEKLSSQLGEEVQTNYVRRSVHEIDNVGSNYEYGSENPMHQYFDANYNPFPEMGAAYQEEVQVDAIGNAEYLVCWNCKDLGHAFMDCPKPIPPGRIFCFGCGAANILKPNCLKCKSNPNRKPYSAQQGHRIPTMLPNPVPNSIVPLVRRPL